MTATTGLTDAEWNLVLGLIVALGFACVAVVAHVDMRDRHADAVADIRASRRAKRTTARRLTAVHPGAPLVARPPEVRTAAWDARRRALRLGQFHRIAKRYIPAGAPRTRPEWMPLPRRGVAWPIPAAGPQALVAQDQQVAGAAIRADVRWERFSWAPLPAELVGAHQ